VLFDARHVESSGIGSYTRQLLCHIPAWADDAGVRVAVLGPATLVDELPPSISHIHGIAAMYTPREQLLLHRVLASYRPRVYWSPHYPMPIASPVPSVVTVLDVLHALPRAAGGPGGGRRVYARAMLASVCRRAARVVTTSSFTADELRRLWPGVASRLTVSTFGIDDRWFEPVASAIQGRPYLLFVGNPKPHKNLPALLKAFALLKDQVPGLDLVLAGGGPNRSIDTTLQSLMRPLGARVRVTGVLSFGQLRRLVAGARALVLPSLYEGVGLPPLEAMAAGTPVIASRAGALVETCGPGATLVDPQSTTEFALVLARMCTDQSARADAIGRGRAHVRARQASVTPRRAWEAVLAARAGLAG